MDIGTYCDSVGVKGDEVICEGFKECREESTPAAAMSSYSTQRLRLSFLDLNLEQVQWVLVRLFTITMTLGINNINNICSINDTNYMLNVLGYHKDRNEAITVLHSVTEKLE